MSGETAIEGGGLRIVFRRLADRYAHRVDFVGGDGALCLLDSVDGTADDAWPPSPPLQELHFENAGAEKQLALLVGRAGASHWSLSIELDATAATIVFDAACRARTAPDRLGVRYLSASTRPEPNDRSADEPSSTLWLPAACRLQAEAVEGGPSCEPPSCELRRAHGELSITPASLAGPWPQTVRWKYSLTRERAIEAPRS